MTEPLRLTALQQAAAVVGAVALFALIVTLIYRRKLREDYAAFWFAAGAFVLVLAIWQDGLRLIAQALDAVTLTAPIFLLSILFLTLVAIHFSIRLSEIAQHIRALAQEVALLRAERERDKVDEPPRADGGT